MVERLVFRVSGGTHAVSDRVHTGAPTFAPLTPGRRKEDGLRAAVRRRSDRSRSLQAFSKHFQIRALFLQAIPSIALAVLCDFNGLQGLQMTIDVFQIFCSLGTLRTRSRRTNGLRSLKRHKNTLARISFLRKINRQGIEESVKSKNPRSSLHARIARTGPKRDRRRGSGSV